MQWLQKYSIDSTSISNNVANTIVVDDIGNIYVSGFTRLDGSSNIKLGIIKYSSTGQQIWVRIDSSSLSSQSSYMDIDKNSNIYIAGTIAKPPFSYSYTTIKYDSSGVIVWKKFDLATTYGTGPSFIKTDKDFNIYLTGQSGAKIYTIKYSQQPIGIINIHGESPDAILLHQNYPNPFNPVTNIKYELSFTTFVKLDVYNVLGEKVKELVNEYKGPGNYQTRFEAGNLASGLYFYRIQAGNFVQTRKMLLVK